MTARRKRTRTPTFIVGAGGFGRTVHQYLSDVIAAGAPLRIAGFIDDRPDALEGFELGPVASGLDAHRPKASHRYVIAVGAPEGRKALAERLSARGARFLTLVHPLAYVAPTALLGDGCVIAPFAYVGPFAEVAANAVIGAHAFVDHDVTVGRFSHVGASAVIAGHARVKDLTWVRSSGSAT